MKRSIAIVLLLLCSGAFAQPDQEEEMSNDRIFSIPSPLQSLAIINQTVETYKSELPNDPHNHSAYKTRVKQALNLGVYGADISYATMFKETAGMLQYLRAITALKDDLSILTNHTNQEMVLSYERNMHNRDSMVFIIQNLYREMNMYLEDNDRTDLSSLILIGGWVEAMYLTSQEALTTNNNELIKRVAENKAVLESVKDLLSVHHEEESLPELFKEIDLLIEAYNDVETNYEYHKPKTDSSKKITTFKSRNETEVSSETLTEITNRFKTLREYIVTGS